MCGQDPFAKVARAVAEVYRVTKGAQSGPCHHFLQQRTWKQCSPTGAWVTVGGTFVSVSHSNDRHSGGHLSPVGAGQWEIKSSRCVYDLEKSGDPQTDGIVFFKYCCTKKGEGVAL